MQVQEGLEAPKIASHRPRSCLHFEREDPAAGLDDEIDFVPGGGAPRAQLGARIPSRGPCPGAPADPCLEPGAPQQAGALREPFAPFTVKAGIFQTRNDTSRRER